MSRMSLEMNESRYCGKGPFGGVAGRERCRKWSAVVGRIEMEMEMEMWWR